MLLLKLLARVLLQLLFKPPEVFLRDTARPAICTPGELYVFRLLGLGLVLRLLLGSCRQFMLCIERLLKILKVLFHLVNYGNITSESLTRSILRGVELRLKLCGLLIWHLGCLLLQHGLLILTLQVFPIKFGFIKLTGMSPAAYLNKLVLVDVRASRETSADAEPIVH